MGTLIVLDTEVGVWKVMRFARSICPSDAQREASRQKPRYTQGKIDHHLPCTFSIAKIIIGLS